MIPRANGIGTISRGPPGSNCVRSDSLRTAWFDDARSLREKLKLVQIDHLRGYAAWRLGVEDPEFWQTEGQ